MIKTNVENIGKWSNIEIEVQCDSCYIEKKLKYKLYTSYGYSNGEYLCKKCKLKKNNLEKFGVENVFQLESVKEKTRKRNLEKFGVEFVSQSPDIKDKIKKSISELDKSKINKKRILTNQSKYGVDNISQHQNTKEKKLKTNLKNWGESNNKKSEKFRKLNFKIANHPNYSNYLNNGSSVFNCDNNHEHQFEINIDNYLKRVKYKTILCTICNPIDKHQSGKEIKLYTFIQSFYKGEIVQNFKIEKKEIDIYLPDLKLGFEFNGVYWHSDIYKEKDFHFKKSKFFEEKGIHIFHIWEDDWNEKEEVIKSQIRNLLGESQKMGARKCEVREITDIRLIKNFLNQNHIQGFVNSKIKIGLFLNGELVSLMTFDQFEGRKKMKDNEWNLNRFCNKLEFSIVGGASKLLQYFIKNYKPNRIISYSDKDWSRGKLYEKLGFVKFYETEPDYKYLVDFKRIHKSNFKKSITGILESNLNIPKIWDCGKIKWELNYLET
jgi:very-short-patch-repair endonuclease